MRIAIFGGSFDPVHNEHVRVAEKAVFSLGLDKLIVMPANIPPHKKEERLSFGETRLETCRLAFAHLNKVEVSDYELKKGGTSYTVETCKHFKALYPNAEIFWLVGTDMLRDFPTWKNPQEILKNVTLAVCARDEQPSWLDEAQADFEQRFGVRFAVVEYNGAPVSSTQIRVLAGAGMPLNEYVPAPVAKYIQRHGLYEIPNAKEALALQNEKRRAHSIRVAETVAKRARVLKIDESKAVTTALMHDCAKNVSAKDPILAGFIPKAEWGKIPPPVLHQFTGAYLAETKFGLRDEDMLNAIRYHTSGRANMSVLEKLIFLADMVEYGRDYDGVERLRELFWDETVPAETALNSCLKEALKRSIAFVKEKGEYVYPLTEDAYAYYKGDEDGK